MPKSRKVRTPLPKESMSSIWSTSFQGTPEAGESYYVQNPDHLSQENTESSAPAASADARITNTKQQRVPIGIPISSSRVADVGRPKHIPITLSRVTNVGRPKHIPIILSPHPDYIPESPYGEYSQSESVKPVSPDGQISSRISSVQRLDSKQPTAHLPSIRGDAHSFNESTQQVQATPNPFTDPMSEISLVTTPEAQPPASGLARVLSRYRISTMVNKTMELRRIFIIALVAMQMAVLSTAAVVAIIFQQIRSGIQPGVAAWLVVSLTLLAAAALTAVIVYWKREKLIKEGGEEYELENQERGQTSRAKDEHIRDLENRNELLEQQVQSLRKKDKHMGKKLRAALGQEDLENAISPRHTRTQSWFLQSSRTAVSESEPTVVSEPEPTTVISLPSLNFNVTPQQGGREVGRSETNTTGTVGAGASGNAARSETNTTSAVGAGAGRNVVKSQTNTTSAVGTGAGGNNLAASEGATSTTGGWETVIGSDVTERQTRSRRFGPGVMRAEELNLLSTEERMSYHGERSRYQQAKLMGGGRGV